MARHRPDRTTASTADGEKPYGNVRYDGIQLAGAGVERADLAAGHLRHVDPAVRAGPQAVRAEQAARRGEPFQVPALGEADGGSADIARLICQRKSPNTRTGTRTWSLNKESSVSP